jgi:hypothetical protein
LLAAQLVVELTAVVVVAQALFALQLLLQLVDLLR